MVIVVVSWRGGGPAQQMAVIFFSRKKKTLSISFVYLWRWSLLVIIIIISSILAAGYMPGSYDETCKLFRLVRWNRMCKNPEIPWWFFKAPQTGFRQIKLIPLCDIFYNKTKTLGNNGNYILYVESGINDADGFLLWVKWTAPPYSDTFMAPNLDQSARLFRQLKNKSKKSSKLILQIQ